MRRVSLRNLRAHKLRLFLTLFSIVLGTTFVVGSIVFTSSISKAFNDIFDSAAQGVAVEVTPADRQSPGVPVEVVDQLRAQREQLGIDKIVVNNSGLVTVADSAGKAIQTGGAPSIGSTWIPPQEALDPDESRIIPGGRGPENAGEIALNKSAADSAGLDVGSKTKVVIGQGNAAPLEVTVVGLIDLPTSTGGYVNAQFDAATASRLFTDGKHVGTVDMSAVEGVTPDELKERVIGALGPAADLYDVRTGDEVRADEKEQVNEFLQIFQYILLAFAAIGLVVGTFIIYNTFSMIVAQRNREFALLRAVGASRQQVSRSVLFEALIVGIIGGVLGLGIGIGLAAALKAFTAATSGLPQGDLDVGVGAILAGILVGVVVTMISAWVPAVRAARVPPVEAMRASAAEGSASLRYRTIAGAVIGIASIVAIVVGATGEGKGPAITVGLGAAGAVLAAVLVGPAASRPFVGALGRIIGAPFGAIGRLARTNAVRNPRRSAATAFALTLGLMLVAIIGTLGQSFKGTVDDAIDAGITADYILTGTNQQPIPPAVSAAAQGVPGVGEVVSFGVVQAKVEDKAEQGFAALGGRLDDVTIMDMEDGASSNLPADGMLISHRTATTKGWERGQVLTFTSATGAEVQVPIAGVYADNEALQPWVIGAAAYDRLVPPAARFDVTVFVKGEPGADLDALRTGLEDATAAFLTVQVQDREQFKGQISSQIDQMLGVLYAMLGLALLIAVLGIINTLALSVVERKREIGMLRAIGMVRGQVRRSIYLESVLISIFGAVVGVVLGTLIGVALVRTLAEWGLGAPVIPWTLIVITLVASAVVGVLAALWPAVRAARTGPLEAIADL
ncbi:ABC transporter permease [Gordonia paraffinivorans]|uniref:ABC transporter permease n=1 Tax=Gordonia paraffinivorans TaxID=175628 RepID=UPI00144806ED|nr:ABC transporter permease [Gordonia paraffinivorans]